MTQRMGSGYIEPYHDSVEFSYGLGITDLGELEYLAVARSHRRGQCQYVSVASEWEANGIILSFEPALEAAVAAAPEKARQDAEHVERTAILAVRDAMRGCLYNQEGKPVAASAFKDAVMGYLWRHSLGWRIMGDPQDNGVASQAVDGPFGTVLLDIDTRQRSWILASLTGAPQRSDVMMTGTFDHVLPGESLRTRLEALVRQHDATRADHDMPYLAARRAALEHLHREPGFGPFTVGLAAATWSLGHVRRTDDPAVPRPDPALRMVPRLVRSRDNPRSGSVPISRRIFLVEDEIGFPRD